MTKKIGDDMCKIAIIDAMNRIYKQTLGLMSKNKYPIDDIFKNNCHIIATYSFTTHLLKNSILPIYVFDGKCPEEKKEAVNKRKKIKEKFRSECEIFEDKTSDDYIKTFKKSFTLTAPKMEECKLMLKYMGIKYVDSPEEADKQCAVMAKYLGNKCMGVISDDLDILLYGSPIILRNFSIMNYNSIKRMEINEVLNDYLIRANNIRLKNNLLPINSFTHQNFLDYNILIGTDYTVIENETKQLFKINIPSDLLFEYFTLVDFDICKLGVVLETNELIPFPNNIMVDKIRSINLIYKNAVFSPPECLDIVPSRIDKNEFYNFMCDKKKITKKFVENELNAVLPYLFAFKHILDNQTIDWNYDYEYIKTIFAKQCLYYNIVNRKR